MVEQSTRKKQKPCGSNLIKLGWTNTSGPLFIRNGNRNSLNLWISSISLSCLPWYWLHVQRPFTLCWLGLNCCVFGSTLNAEPTVVISRTDSATEKTSGTVFAIMLVPAACTPPPPPFWPHGSSPAWQTLPLYSRSWHRTCHGSAWFLHWKE